jgi:hypothetical protein
MPSHNDTRLMSQQRAKRRPYRPAPASAARVLTFALLLLFLASGSTLAGDCVPHRSYGGDVLLYSRADLERNLELWPQRDGLGGQLLSDYFVDFAIINPGTFLETMADNPAIFGEWLDSLANLSFVDRGGCLDLECRRHQLITTLRRFPAAAQRKAISSRLLAVAEKIQVRTVD